MGMKKIYLKPYVETANMRFNYVICGTTGGGKVQPENPDDVPPPGGGGMPGKVF